MTEPASDPFRDRVAVITGTASGIGAGIARVLVAAGSSVVLADIDEPALETVATELRAAEGRVLVCRTDVSEAGELERLAAATIEGFIFTHDDSRERIDRRMQRIGSGLDRLASRSEGEGEA